MNHKFVEVWHFCPFEIQSYPQVEPIEFTPDVTPYPYKTNVWILEDLDEKAKKSCLENNIPIKKDSAVTVIIVSSPIGDLVFLRTPLDADQFEKTLHEEPSFVEQMGSSLVRVAQDVYPKHVYTLKAYVQSEYYRPISKLREDIESPQLHFEIKEGKLKTGKKETALLYVTPHYFEASGVSYDSCIELIKQVIATLQKKIGGEFNPTVPKVHYQFNSTTIFILSGLEIDFASYKKYENSDFTWLTKGSTVNFIIIKTSELQSELQKGVDPKYLRNMKELGVDARTERFPKTGKAAYLMAFASTLASINRLFWDIINLNEYLITRSALWLTDTEAIFESLSRERGIPYVDETYEMLIDLGLTYQRCQSRVMGLTHMTKYLQKPEKALHPFLIEMIREKDMVNRVANLKLFLKQKASSLIQFRERIVQKLYSLRLIEISEHSRRILESSEAERRRIDLLSLIVSAFVLAEVAATLATWYFKSGSDAGVVLLLTLIPPLIFLPFILMLIRNRTSH